MPIKFKPSSKVYNKQTKQYQVQHYYMKTIPMEELIAYLESSNAKPKIKQKVRNEITRRTNGR